MQLKISKLNMSKSVQLEPMKTLNSDMYRIITLTNESPLGSCSITLYKVNVLSQFVPQEPGDPPHTGIR